MKKKKNHTLTKTRVLMILSSFENSKLMKLYIFWICRINIHVLMTNTPGIVWLWSLLNQSKLLKSLHKLIHGWSTTNFFLHTPKGEGLKIHGSQKSPFIFGFGSSWSWFDLQVSTTYKFVSFACIFFFVDWTLIPNKMFWNGISMTPYPSSNVKLILTC
jgi:hypothetical protein